MDEEEGIAAKRRKVNCELSGSHVWNFPSRISSHAQQIINQCNGSYSRSRPLHVTILASGWFGGLFEASLYTRVLARQLAKFDDVKVTCLVPEKSCSKVGQEDAASARVEILEAKKQPGFIDPIEWLNFPPEGLTTDIVVGVGEKFGKMAKRFQEHQHCKCMVFVSDKYEELNLEIKELSDALADKKKQKLELRHRSNSRDILQADLSVAIGPQMSQELRQNHRTRVFEFTPGILSDFADMTHDTSKRTKFKILSMGGDDPEYFDCEGLDIVANAVAKLNDRSCELIYAGAAEYGDEGFVKEFCRYGVSKNQLRVRSLPESEEELKRWFREVDLVILPSSEQKFGIMGLAALSAGLPVLVHSDSGFGEALKDVTFGDTATVDSEDATEWAKEIRKLQKRSRQLRLEQASELRSFYDEKYSWERQCGALINEMFNMVLPNKARDNDMV